MEAQIFERLQSSNVTITFQESYDFTGSRLLLIYTKKFTELKPKPELKRHSFSQQMQQSRPILQYFQDGILDLLHAITSSFFLGMH